MPQPSSEWLVLVLLALTARWIHVMDEWVVHYGEQMLALISVQRIVPPFSDVYGIFDVAWWPLIFLGQYLSIVPIYIMIILAYMVWNSRFVHDRLWCFRLFPSEMLITKFIYFLLMFHTSHSKWLTGFPHIHLVTWDTIYYSWCTCRVPFVFGMDKKIFQTHVWTPNNKLV